MGSQFWTGQRTEESLGTVLAPQGSASRLLAQNRWHSKTTQYNTAQYSSLGKLGRGMLLVAATISHLS